MRKRTGLALTGLALAGCVAFWLSGACTTVNVGGLGGGGGMSADVPFSLSGGLGTFDVEAGVPAENTGTGSFSSGGAIGSGTFKINPDDISIQPSGSSGNKGTANLQSGGTVTITGWVAGIDELATVCDSADEYGPYTVVVVEDADGNLTVDSVTPSSIDFSANTLSLLETGEFSLCIRVEADFDAVITIRELTFGIGA